MTDPRRVYLDTNVFIEAYEQVSARADHARWLLDAVEDGRLLAVTSELTLGELLIKPLQLKAHALAEAYKQIFEGTSSFEVVPVRREILVRAAQVRADRRAIRLPDAIHVATARERGCDCIVSGDGRLRTPAGPAARTLGPFTVDEVLGTAR